jgi:hypothetical protein
MVKKSIPEERLCTGPAVLVLAIRGALTRNEGVDADPADAAELE